MARIVLQLGGLEADRGRVRLAVFLEELQHLSAALHRADEIATGGRRVTSFQIVGLSYSSPVMVALEARPLSNKVPDVRDVTVRIFTDALKTVESGKLNESKIDYELLRHVREFVEPVGKKVSSAAISLNDHHFEMVPAYVAQIDSALAPIDYCIGAIDGMLEKMNIHAGANQFTLYPVVGPPSITCRFGVATRDKALGAMGRRVEIRGRLAYRRDAPYPHEIEVEGIEIYQPVEELTNLADLRGRSPNATGDKSSEDFIAELRSAW
jgi:hypothetical protein